MNPAGVRLVFRHLPFWQIRGHELSRAQAALSEMAAEKGKFWQFVTTVYSRPKLDRAGYLALMETLGFEAAAVETRLADPNDPAVARVLRDEKLAERLNINQTPTFIVLLDGHQPISANQRTLTRLLNSPEVQSRLAHAAAAASAGKTSK
jgi:protein-disulfide isomerase